MPDCLLELENNGEIVLKGLEGLPSRQFSKAKLFLSSLPSTASTFPTGQIKITILSTNSVEKGKIALHIAKFFLSLSDQIVLGPSLKKLTSQANDEINSFQEKRDQIVSEKNRSLDAAPEFQEFCKFCDDHLAVHLRPYQYKAAFYLSLSESGFDFSVPGSGKTIISYAVYEYLKEKKGIKSLLVVGPKTAHTAWEEEYFTCFHKTPSFLNLSDEGKNDCRSYLKSSSNFHNEITFINFEKVRELSQEICDFLDSSSCLLIIDEGHRVKNPDASQTKAVLNFSKHATFRILLTGTPMPNGYEDLDSLTKIVFPFEKIIPFSYNQLATFTKSSNSKTPLPAGTEKAIIDSLKPFYSRVSKKYLLATKEILPANYIPPIMVTPSPEQREIYDVLNNFSSKIAYDWESSFQLALMRAVVIRKMQVSANPGLLSQSILDSIDSYEEDYENAFGDKETAEKELVKADKEIQAAIQKSNLVRLISGFASNSFPIPKNEKALSLVKGLVQSGKKVVVWDIFVQNMAVLQKALIESGIKTEMVNGSITGFCKGRIA